MNTQINLLSDDVLDRVVGGAQLRIRSTPAARLTARLGALRVTTMASGG